MNPATLASPLIEDTEPSVDVGENKQAMELEKMGEFVGINLCVLFHDLICSPLVYIRHREEGRHCVN